MCVRILEGMEVIRCSGFVKWSFFPNSLVGTREGGGFHIFWGSQVRWGNFFIPPYAGIYGYGDNDVAFGHLNDALPGIPERGSLRCILLQGVAPIDVSTKQDR